MVAVHTSDSWAGCQDGGAIRMSPRKLGPVTKLASLWPFPSLKPPLSMSTDRWTTYNTRIQLLYK